MVYLIVLDVFVVATCKRHPLLTPNHPPVKVKVRHFNPSPESSLWKVYAPSVNKVVFLTCWLGLQRIMLLLHVCPTLPRHSSWRTSKLLWWEFVGRIQCTWPANKRVQPRSDSLYFILQRLIVLTKGLLSINNDFWVRWYRSFSYDNVVSRKNLSFHTSYDQRSILFCASASYFVDVLCIWL